MNRWNLVEQIGRNSWNMIGGNRWNDWWKNRWKNSLRVIEYRVIDI